MPYSHVEPLQCRARRSHALIDRASARRHPLADSKWHESRETDIAACAVTKKRPSAIEFEAVRQKTQLTYQERLEQLLRYKYELPWRHNGSCEAIIRNFTPRTRPCEYVFQHDRPN